MQRTQEPDRQPVSLILELEKLKVWESHHLPSCHDKLVPLPFAPFFLRLEVLAAPRVLVSGSRGVAIIYCHGALFPSMALLCLVLRRLGWMQDRSLLCAPPWRIMASVWFRSSVQRMVTLWVWTLLGLSLGGSSSSQFWLEAVIAVFGTWTNRFMLPQKPKHHFLLQAV